MQVLADLAQALGIPSSVLGVADEAGRGPRLDGVDRRDVLGGSVGVAVTLLLPHGVATAGRIGPEDLAQCWTALRRIEELDAHQGGATVCQVAEGIAQRLREALRSGSYAAELGGEFQRLTLAAMDQAGWLAYDAGFPQRARHWWLETCHLADLAGVVEARVSAMTTMALHAIANPRTGGEAIGLVRAARDAAKNSATPMLLSLLAAREAVGHALSGDHPAAAASLATARTRLDQGRRGDEPFWLDFWGPADLAGHETQVALAARNGRDAENAARAALASSDASSFPRNHIIYTVNLGSVLAQLRQLDEAISVTSAAIQAVQQINGSGRTIARLRRTVDLLGKQNYPPAQTFAAAARRLLPPSA